MCLRMRHIETPLWFYIQYTTFIYYLTIYYLLKIADSISDYRTPKWMDGLIGKHVEASAVVQVDALSRHFPREKNE
jgi:hypothetical protein